MRARRGRGRGRRGAGAAVAVPAGGAGGRRARDLLGGSARRRRVPPVGPRRGGASLGPAEAETQHELRQAVQGTQILLRQEYYEQGARQAICIPLQLGGADGRVPGAGRRHAALLALSDAAAPHHRQHRQHHQHRLQRRRDGSARAADHVTLTPLGHATSIVLSHV